MILRPSPSTALIHGDAREVLPRLKPGSVQTCITSPPYFALRSYGSGDGEIGTIDQSLTDYLKALLMVFRGVRDVLADDGTCFIVIGDSYTGSGKGPASSKSMVKGTAERQGYFNRATKVEGLGRKQLIGVPWRLGLALQRDGWILRQQIIWQKPNARPESMRDRFTNDCETVLMLSKSPTYQFDASLAVEPAADGAGTRRRRSVWSVPISTGAKSADGQVHSATFPPALIRPMVEAATTPGQVILDPFAGAGTTLAVAQEMGRKSIGIELNREYLEALAVPRLKEAAA